MNLGRGLTFAIWPCCPTHRWFAGALLGLAMALLPGTGQAAVLAVQGSLKVQGTVAVPDGTYSLSFRLYDGPTATEPLWKDGPTDVASSAGAFATSLGQTSPLTPQVFAGDPWLSVQVGGDPELPRVQLRSVALAVRSEVAGALACSGCVTADHLHPMMLAGLAKAADLAKVAKSGHYTDLQGLPDLAPYVKAADLAKVATSSQYADLQGTPDLAPYAKSAQLAKIATTGHYADLQGAPNLAPYAKAADLVKVAASGQYADLQGLPVLAKVGTGCGSGLLVKGIAADGSLQCGEPSVAANIAVVTRLNSYEKCQHKGGQFSTKEVDPSFRVKIVKARNASLLRVELQDTVYVGDYSTYISLRIDGAPITQPTGCQWFGRKFAGQVSLSCSVSGVAAGVHEFSVVYSQLKNQNCECGAFNNCCPLTYDLMLCGPYRGDAPGFKAPSEYSSGVQADSTLMAMEL